jgi:tripartite ATP-independent transporter DctP family solute receptor
MHTFKLSASSLAVLLLAAAGAQAQTTTLTMGHATSLTNPRHIASVKFAELVSKKTAGRVEVKVSANGEAGDDAAMLKALKAGTLDISANSQGAVSREVPEFAAVGLPFTFPSQAKAWQVLDGPVGKELADKAAAKGYVLLGAWDNGIRQITNNVRPVLKPEDLKGLKMRTPPDPVTVDIMTALSAEAHQIKFTELAGALKAGVVDGQENPLANIEAGKLYEVQKYLSLTAHKYEMTPLLMRSAALDKLSEADRKAVREAAKEATALQRKLSKEADDSLLAVLKDKGMKIDKPDAAPFVKATSGVTEKWLTSEIGPFVKSMLTAAR